MRSSIHALSWIYGISRQFELYASFGKHVKNNLLKKLHIFLQHVVGDVVWRMR